MKIRLELIWYCLKWKSVFFKKVTRNWCTNASKLSNVSEDLWIRGSICDHFWLSTLAPGAIRILFVKKSWMSQNMFVNQLQKYQIWDDLGPGLRWRAQIWSKWIENSIIKLFKTLPGPREAIFDQFWPKSTKNWHKTNPYISSLFNSRSTALGGLYFH